MNIYFESKIKIITVIFIILLNLKEIIMKKQKSKYLKIEIPIEESYID